MSLHFDAYASRKQWNHARELPGLVYASVYVCTYTRNYATTAIRTSRIGCPTTECVSPANVNTKCERKRLSRSCHPRISPFPSTLTIETFRFHVKGYKWRSIFFTQNILIHAVKSAVGRAKQEMEISDARKPILTEDCKIFEKQIYFKFMKLRN